MATMEWVTTEWRRAALLDMAGCGAEAGKLEAIESLWAIEGEADDDVCGVALGEGWTAWATRYGDRWGLIAIAPRGSRFAPGCVRREAFFSERWPSDWFCRVNVAKAEKALRDKGKVRAECQVGGNCYGIAGAVCLLAEIASVREGVPYLVRLAPDAPAVLASSVPVKEWWIPDRYVDGFRKLFQQGRVDWHNYRLLCMVAANTQKRLGAPGRRKAGRTQSEAPKAAPMASEPEGEAFRRPEWLDGYEAQLEAIRAGRSAADV